MFILREGQAVACIKGDEGEVEVMQYKKGDYFGEIALLTGEPRKASVYAVDKVLCYYISRPIFRRLLGPLQDFLKNNIEKYTKYSDAIRDAAQSAIEDPGSRLSSRGSTKAQDKLEVFEGGSPKRSGKVVSRKRDHTLKVQKKEELPERRPSKDALEKDADLPSEKAASSSKVAITLKEKIAQDFEVPALVTPNPDKFTVPKDAKFQAFGGLRLGETFSVDKVVVCKTEATLTTEGTEDNYTWTGPSKLKGSTDVAVTCQKGQKSASDPTPNQDNYFILNVGEIGIYGVCDGHGPFGHLVSFRLVQSLPHLLTSNPNFNKDWEVCLKEAFIAAQQELLAFCRTHDINVEASGAAGSVLVFDGAAVHTAHIGDSTVMLGSWNRRDSRLIHGTKDHKPQDAEEKARLEAAGSEVRQVDEESWRIYLKGSTFPGLTMSRAFGDTACAGVLQEPEYAQFFMQESDEWYAIVASDGIWEFMEPDKVLDMSAKKLRLKGGRETIRFLTEASRKRWVHCCGDYCDDITAILIQWNLQQKGDSAAAHNYAVHLTRYE